VLIDGSQPLSRRHGVLIAVLLIGAPTSFNELWRAMTLRHVPADYSRTFIDSQKGGLPGHYVGRLGQPLLVDLLRTPGPVPTQAERKKLQAK
jgi:hypothetical protein